VARTILKLSKPRTLLKLKKPPKVKTNKKPVSVEVKQEKIKIPPIPKTPYKVFKKQSQALLTILKANHPDLFPPKGTPPKPWKIHINRDVKKRYKVTNRIAKMALRFWRRCNHEVYIEALIPGVDRFDLDGKPNGTVKDVWLTLEHNDLGSKKQSTRSNE